MAPAAGPVKHRSGREVRLGCRGPAGGRPQPQGGEQQAAEGDGGGHDPDFQTGVGRLDPLQRGVQPLLAGLQMCLHGVHASRIGRPAAGSVNAVIAGPCDRAHGGFQPELNAAIGGAEPGLCANEPTLSAISLQSSG